MVVRDRAALLLSACLEIVKNREREQDDTYKRLFNEARNGLGKVGQTVSTENILGSLLAFGSMLQNQQLVRNQVFCQIAHMQSIQDYFRAICDETLRFRDHKELVIRKAVIALIPIMATYDSETFQQHYLHRCVQYLTACLSKPTDRDIGTLL